MSSASASPSGSDFSLPQRYDGPPRYDPSASFSIPRSYPGDLDLDRTDRTRPAPPSPPSQPEHKMRLRKACDSCSIRKVKCDESGPPCRSCAALDIPCTFERPSRRRGPPNRHAEAFKRQKLEHNELHLDLASPIRDAATSLASLSVQPLLSAESICDISTLRLLIDDYFTYIHPLVPLPHEPTFRAAFAQRKDRTDRTFLALLAVMIEALVVSFPRRPSQLFTSENSRKQFPNAEALISRCHQVYVEARGRGYLDKDLMLDDACASYLAGLSAAYTFDLRRNRLYIGEGIIILRVLGLHKAKSPGDPGAMDYISQEIARRLFWLFYVGSASVRQLGASDSELLMPPMSYLERYPPMPLEIDDPYIFRDHVLPQPPGLVSELAGFNLNVKVFQSYQPLTSLEMAFGANELYDWHRQQRMIVQVLQNVKNATDDAPPELQLHPSTAGVWPWPAKLSVGTNRDTSNWMDASGFNDGRDYVPSSQSMRAMQCEIQKANIYTSQLATRSHLVEKYWNLYELQDRHASPQSTGSPTLGCFVAGVDAGTRGWTSSEGPDVSEHGMAIEREDIVRDLAVLLQSISQVNMEPNGLSFCHKIRQVASTLLETPRSRMAMPSLDPESVNVYLTGFLDILMRLERLGPSRVKSGVEREHGVLSAGEIEEEELVHWASLKDHQERFAREAGFVTHI